MINQDEKFTCVQGIRNLARQFKSWLYSNWEEICNKHLILAFDVIFKDFTNENELVIKCKEIDSIDNVIKFCQNVKRMVFMEKINCNDKKEEAMSIWKNIVKEI